MLCSSQCSAAAGVHTPLIPSRCRQLRIVQVDAGPPRSSSSSKPPPYTRSNSKPKRVSAKRPWHAHPPASPSTPFRAAGVSRPAPGCSKRPSGRIAPLRDRRSTLARHCRSAPDRCQRLDIAAGRRGASCQAACAQRQRPLEAVRGDSGVQRGSGQGACVALVSPAPAQARPAWGLPL